MTGREKSAPHLWVEVDHAWGSADTWAWVVYLQFQYEGGVMGERTRIAGGTAPTQELAESRGKQARDARAKVFGRAGL